MTCKNILGADVGGSKVQQSGVKGMSMRHGAPDGAELRQYKQASALSDKRTRKKIETAEQAVRVNTRQHFNLMNHQGRAQMTNSGGGRDLQL